MDNNLVSIKIGDKVFSTGNGYSWTDVAATYPYVGGTLQTEFGYDDSTIQSLGEPIEEGGYFIFGEMVWKLCKFADSPEVYAAKVLPTYNSGKYGLPIYFDAYLDGAILFEDDNWEHRLTEMPHDGDSFYFPNGNLQLLSNVTIYPTVTAGTTATDTPPVATYDKPLIYNRDLDCIEKSLGNIEVVGDMKAGSVTTPSLNVTQPVENLTVENLTVTDTASINHATIVTEEDIHSEADFIELRVDNPLPTPSTGSGFKVKNYDGNNNSLELVTDSSGTFRIGAENSLQSIATREEATQLNNNDLFAWDATNNQLKHITRPTVNGTALKAIVTNGAVTGYDWGSSGGSGVSFIGTRAAYDTAKLIPEGQDGYIPAGSLVIITDEDELIIGEDA